MTVAVISAPNELIVLAHCLSSLGLEACGLDLYRSWKTWSLVTYLLISTHRSFSEMAKSIINE